MEHLPSAFQAASLGSVGVLLLQPDGAHLALYGVVFAGLCSIITTAMNRRADRVRDDVKYSRDKEEREWQAAQVRAAFAAAVEQRDAGEARIVAKVQESTSASATALDASNHLTEKLANATEALRDAVRAKE